MANVNVTYQEMESAGARLVAGEQEINGQLDALTREVRGLVQSGYVTDSSSKQFEASYDEFTDGAKKVLHGLEGMSTYLKAAARTFQEADTQLASQLGR